MSDDFDPHLTIGDMRPLYCVKGVKKGFETAGLDFPTFLTNGARASELRGHGYDAVIDRVVESLRAKEPTDG
ncbi:hypothetical protein BPNPMPFG_002517 [Mesorhizobium sp. AR07]|uniref:hypothetical protein n=1 Tax=Mesorhizobium sp. AR07 TaxID=2865838 RepID=UPI00215FF0FD|nr:hypothetical protein [Mesorhizobium sp. AR07]UVK46807.1 hypothetical protein BPNPMPFG_002517 [Mesorhizobium sp. AR07]